MYGKESWKKKNRNKEMDGWTDIKRNSHKKKQMSTLIKEQYRNARFHLLQTDILNYRVVIYRFLKNHEP